MTDNYRTSENPYAAKAAAARAKLEASRHRATEEERQRVTMLAEINEAIAPLRVERFQGGPFEANTIRLTRPLTRVILATPASVVTSVLMLRVWRKVHAQ